MLKILSVAYLLLSYMAYGMEGDEEQTLLNQRQIPSSYQTNSPLKIMNQKTIKAPNQLPLLNKWWQEEALCLPQYFKTKGDFARGGFCLLGGLSAGPIFYILGEKGAEAIVQSPPWRGIVVPICGITSGLVNIWEFAECQFHALNYMTKAPSKAEWQLTNGEYRQNRLAELGMVGVGGGSFLASFPLIPLYINEGSPVLGAPLSYTLAIISTSASTIGLTFPFLKIQGWLSNPLLLVPNCGTRRQYDQLLKKSHKILAGGGNTQLLKDLENILAPSSLHTINGEMSEMGELEERDLKLILFLKRLKMEIDHQTLCQKIIEHSIDLPTAGVSCLIGLLAAYPLFNLCKETIHQQFGPATTFSGHTLEYLAGLSGWSVMTIFHSIGNFEIFTRLIYGALSLKQMSYQDVFGTNARQGAQNLTLFLLQSIQWMLAMAFATTSATPEAYFSFEYGGQKGSTFATIVTTSVFISNITAGTWYGYSQLDKLAEIVILALKKLCSGATEPTTASILTHNKEKYLRSLEELRRIGPYLPFETVHQIMEVLEEKETV